MQIRQSSNARFFRGTVLEPGRAEQIFAPPGSSPSRPRAGRGGQREAGRDENAHPSVRRRKKFNPCDANAGGSRGGRDRADARRKPFAALARRRRVVGETNRRRRSGARLVVRVAETRFARKDPSAGVGSRRARSPRALALEKSAEGGWTRISRNRADARSARPRAGNRRDEDEDAASDVTMQDIWEALRGAPNPKIPPERRRRGVAVQRGRRRFGSSAARRRRRRRAAARGLLPHAGRRRAREAAARGAARPRRRAAAQARVGRAARAERGGGRTPASGSRRGRRSATRASCTPTPSAARPPDAARRGVPTCASTPTPEETGLMCPGTTKRDVADVAAARGRRGARARLVATAAATTRVSPAGSSRASSGTPPRGRLRKRRAWDCEMCRRR